MEGIMKRPLLMAVLLGLAVVVVGSPAALAQGSGTPTGGMQCLINGKYVFVAHGGCPGGGGNPRVNQPNQPAYDNGAAAAAAAATAEAEAERRRLEEIDNEIKEEVDAQKLRDAEAARQARADFERRKEEALKDLKGTSEGESGLKDDSSGSYGLKDLGDTGSTGLKDTQPAQPAWDVRVTDPRVAKLARSIYAIVPPAPVPKEEAPIEWKHIYLNEETLMKSADRLMALWEMTGPLGSPVGKPLKVIMIAGKTFIAGENGAALYLVKQDQTYSQALNYLKNPVQSQQFARLVQAIRENRPLPSSADPGMVSVALAIADPKLAHGTAPLAWDFMTSREALSAMLRKAAIDIGSDVISEKAGKLLTDEKQRKEVFDALRLERRQAVNMMGAASTTTPQHEQLKIVIDRANRTMADIYRVERITDTLRGVVIGDATDKLATVLLGPEAGSHEHK
jgi:hypothetical protein